MRMKVTKEIKKKCFSFNEEYLDRYMNHSYKMKVAQMRINREVLLIYQKSGVNALRANDSNSKL